MRKAFLSASGFTKTKVLVSLAILFTIVFVGYSFLFHKEKERTFGQVSQTTEVRVEKSSGTEGKMVRTDNVPNELLEPVVFTVNSIQTLRPPKGWESQIGKTLSPTSVQVSFQSKDGASVVFSSFPNGTDGKRHSIEEYVAGEVNLESQNIIKKEPVTILGAAGYVVEKTNTTRYGIEHSKMYSLLKNGVIYQIGGSSQEKDWVRFQELIDASIATSVLN
jgi:hypothetical protein